MSSSSPIRRPPARDTGHLRAGLALGLAANQVVGAAVARKHDLVGEPLGLRLPAVVPGPLELACWGTAISGPLVFAPILVGGRRRPELRWLAALMVAGQLVEPVVWRRRRPRAATAVIAVNLVLSGALAVSRSA